VAEEEFERQLEALESSRKGAERQLEAFER